MNPFKLILKANHWLHVQFERIDEPYKFLIFFGVAAVFWTASVLAPEPISAGCSGIIVAMLVSRVMFWYTEETNG